VVAPDTVAVGTASSHMSDRRPTKTGRRTTTHDLIWNKV